MIVYTVNKHIKFLLDTNILRDLVKLGTTILFWDTEGAYLGLVLKNKIEGSEKAPTKIASVTK